MTVTNPLKTLTEMDVAVLVDEVCVVMEKLSTIYNHKNNR